MKWLKKLFCFHVWDDGHMHNSDLLDGVNEYTCVKCGKKYFENEIFY